MLEKYLNISWNLIDNIKVVYRKTINFWFWEDFLKHQRNGLILIINSVSGNYFHYIFILEIICQECRVCQKRRKCRKISQVRLWYFSTFLTQ